MVTVLFPVKIIFPFSPGAEVPHADPTDQRDRTGIVPNPLPDPDSTAAISGGPDQS